MTTVSHPVRAAAWMSGAIVSFSSMAVAGRAVSHQLDTFEVMLFRSLIGIAIVLTVGGLTGALRGVTRRRLPLHMIRNISHFTGQNLWFYAITVIPLAQVFALEFTSPLWVTLFAPVLLGERLTKTRGFAAIVGFIGILIVARPDPSHLDIGVMAAALSAVGFAGSAIFTKMLTRTETITCILFYLTVMQASFGLICAGLDGDIAVPTLATWPWLVLIGMAGLLAHFCLTKALSIAPAVVVIPFDFIRLPAIAIIGMLVYGEPLQWPVLLGAVLIFGANYLNIWTETRNLAFTTQPPVKTF